MSTIEYNLYEKIYVRNVIQFGVNDTQVKGLADFVRITIRDKNLSYRKVASKSRGLITHSTVGEVIRGEKDNPALNIILGLAYGLGVDPAEVFAAACGETLSSEHTTHFQLEAAARIYNEIVTDEGKLKAELLISMLPRELERIRLEEELRAAGNDATVNEKGEVIIKVPSSKFHREGR